MLKKLHRGLFVIELMGQGVNYVTGDYSRGAAGFWVENGKIAYPVHEITIAGNLRQMFKGIVRRRRRYLCDGQQDDRLGAGRPDEDRGRLSESIEATDVGSEAIERPAQCPVANCQSLPERVPERQNARMGFGNDASSSANLAISSGLW